MNPDSDAPNVWPPAPTVPAPASIPVPSPRRSRFAFIAVAVGLALSLVDIRLAGSGIYTLLMFAPVAAVLGFIHPARTWLWGLILSLCLFIVHALAIGFGFKSPYVEEDVWTTLMATAVIVMPCCILAAMAGAGIKIVIRKISSP